MTAPCRKNVRRTGEGSWWNRRKEHRERWDAACHRPLLLGSWLKLRPSNRQGEGRGGRPYPDPIGVAPGFAPGPRDLPLPRWPGFHGDPNAYAPENPQPLHTDESGTPVGKESGTPVGKESGTPKSRRNGERLRAREQALHLRSNGSRQRYRAKPT